jgi:hypothetical protein
MFGDTAEAINRCYVSAKVFSEQRPDRNRIDITAILDRGFSNEINNLLIFNYLVRISSP